MRQNDTALQKQQKYMEEEVDDNKWKIKHLEELLNRKENEMTQIIHKNEILEKKLMENYKSIPERDQTLKNLDLTVKELEKIINNRDLTVKDLEEKLQKMRTEIRDESESLVTEVKDKDQQLSKQAARLQQILNQLHEKESELGGTISLLKRQIQGKDDHISKLKQALKLLGDRESEMKEIDTSLRTKLEYLEKELESREREVETHLEDMLNSKTAEITKMSAQNEYLENKLKEKDELIDQRDRVLKEQQEAETELCGIITSLQKKNEDLETDINDRDLTVKDLEKRLERMRMEISGGNERLILAMTEKDKQISKQAAKLQHALNQLHETEAELGGIITSLKKQIQGKDDQISKLGDQLKQTLELLDDKESEVKEIDATLRKKIEYLQEELERRERKAETNLQEMLNRKTAEITKMRAETDLLEIKLKENDKQSDQRDRILRLQKAETECSRIINSLQEKNHGLDTDIKGRDKKLKDLEEKNANMKTESRVENERLIMEVMEKDKQISEQTLRLEQALSQFHVKETKLGETIILLRTESQAKDGLLSELRDQLKQTLEKLDARDSELKEIETSLQEMERQKRKAEIHLKEMLKNTNVEKSNVRKRNETLENKVMEKDKQLIEQRDQLRQTVKQMNETQDKLDGVITSQKKKIQHLQREVERRDLKINDIEKLLHSTKTENRGNQQSEAVIEKEVKIAELKNQLQKTLTTLQDTEAELDETKTRLSKAMGDRLTDNNPNITDLSDKNRPTKLAERCAELYDNQWTDAFDILDKYFDTEENVIGALLEILQDTMTFCIKRAHEQMEELGRELKFADQHGNGDVSADVRKLFKDCRKAVAPVAVGNLYTMYESRLKRSTDNSLRTALEVSSYTSECLEICWFMTIQDPPVAFAPLLRKGSSFNTDLYKPYTSSGTNIDYVVWPPLLLHESGPILAKGVAQGYGKKSKKSAEFATQTNMGCCKSKAKKYKQEQNDIHDGTSQHDSPSPQEPQPDNVRSNEKMAVLPGGDTQPSRTSVGDGAAQPSTGVKINNDSQENKSKVTEHKPDNRRSNKKMAVLPCGDTQPFRTYVGDGTAEHSTEEKIKNGSHENKSKVTEHEQDNRRSNKKMAVLPGGDTQPFRTSVGDGTAEHSTEVKIKNDSHENKSKVTELEQDNRKEEAGPAVSVENTPITSQRTEYEKKYEQMGEQCEKTAQDVQSRDKEIQKLHDDIASKENEIKRLKQNIKEGDTKEKELAELKSKVNEMTAVEKRMQQEIKNKKSEIKKLEKEANEEVADTMDKIDTLRKEKVVALAKKDQEIKKLEEEKDQLLLRLSEMAGRRLTDNNPNIADLSDLNRPTKLAEKYAELYDNEWTDAFSYLETLDVYKSSDTQVIYALMTMLTTAYKVSWKTADRQLETLRSLLNEFHGNSTNRNQQVNDVLKQLKDHRKRAIQPSNELSKEYRMEIEKDLPKLEPKVFDSDALKSYLQRCLELCWLMVIQDPPVYLNLKGSKKKEPFDKNIYKEYTQSGPFVKYIVWPAVFLEKGGALLCKGVVQCDKEFTSSLRKLEKKGTEIRRHSSSLRVSGDQPLTAVSAIVKTGHIEGVGTYIATDDSHSENEKKQTIESTAATADYLQGQETKL
ncbi:uncharacterized protein LOC128557337 [Mercenaria mercenaria]|uniref:uncharacterized protein LOC128557337 n=1 Tax=Mercenaria mercenaria TaxID=6596 RepID=UPI00234F6DFC|nr:uncharacterized protein LOC128557337 [Mercenaria mercenaria]